METEQDLSAAVQEQAAVWAAAEAEDGAVIAREQVRAAVVCARPAVPPFSMYREHPVMSSNARIAASRWSEAEI